MPGLMFLLDGEDIWNSLLSSHPGKEQTEEGGVGAVTGVAVLVCLQPLKHFPLPLLGTMCYLGITNGGGCSRMTCLLGKGRGRNTTTYLHSEEYKARFWVKSLLCYKTKILDFLSQPGNSRGWARLTDTHLQPSTQLGRGFHPLLPSGVPTADRSEG